ncbi:MAG: hypothetical protein AB1489_25610, partial [Acidobacteriota bacterium]
MKFILNIYYLWQDSVANALLHLARKVINIKTSSNKEAELSVAATLVLTTLPPNIARAGLLISILTSIRDKPAGRNIFSLASNCQEWNEITSRVVKRRHSKLLSMK